MSDATEVPFLSLRRGTTHPDEPMAYDCNVSCPVQKAATQTRLPNEPLSTYQSRHDRWSSYPRKSKPPHQGASELILQDSADDSRVIQT